MKTFVYAILIGFVIGLVIGWAYGKAQPEQNRGTSLGGVIGAIGSIFG